MSEKKYDLGRCHFGNGTSIYNRSVEVDGDYQSIAHIDDNGVISWRIKNPPVQVISYVKNISNDPKWMYKKHAKQRG